MQGAFGLVAGEGSGRMLHRVFCLCLLFGFSEDQGIHLKAVVGLQALQVITYHGSFIVEFFPQCSCKNILWM